MPVATTGGANAVSEEASITETPGAPASHIAGSQAASDSTVMAAEDAKDNTAADETRTNPGDTAEGNEADPAEDKENGNYEIGQGPVSLWVEYLTGGLTGEPAGPGDSAGIQAPAGPGNSAGNQGPAGPGNSTGIQSPADPGSGAGAQPPAGPGNNNSEGQTGSDIIEIPAASEFREIHKDGTIYVTVPEPPKPLEHVVWDSCRIEGSEIILDAHMDGGFTPYNTKMGEDRNIYLLELQPWEDSLEGHDFSRMLPKNTRDLTFSLDLLRNTKFDRLYSRFVACIWDGEKYIAVSDPVWITNPEAAALDNRPYVEPPSKKGLLIELPEVADAFELGVCNVIVNIPVNHIMGNGIKYEYDGEVYEFSSRVISKYDQTISAFSNRKMNVTAVLLNGFNPSMPQLYFPGTRQKNGVHFYHFNTATSDGVRTLKAIATFLAQRYNGSNSEHGKIQNWIIGNEINNQEWNYIGPLGIHTYVKEYCRSFRLFYNAIRSTCANDRVFFSVDCNWNRAGDGQLKYPARDVIRAVAAEFRAQGDIAWGLAYHPYCDPLNEPEFWDDYGSGQVSYQEDSPVVNFANLGVLTDYMQKPEFLTQEGLVRHIILSEEGFTSRSATRGNVEKLQAAAFAYAYYIADSNPYIDAFILSRQIDAPSELKQSMAFGLWTTASTSDGDIRPEKKKYIWEVFRDIDNSERTLEATAFARELLGVPKWSDLIPNFRWTMYERP